MLTKFFTTTNRILITTGYIIGTMIAYMIGYDLFTSLVDSMSIYARCWNLLAFTFGYMFIYLFCPRWNKLYVTIICMLLITVSHYLSGSFVLHTAPFYILEYITTIFPLVLGGMLIWGTKNKETVIYRRLTKKDIIGSIIGYVLLSIPLWCIVLNPKQPIH